jgi:hypothetical protein
MAAKTDGLEWKAVVISGDDKEGMKLWSEFQKAQQVAKKAREALETLGRKRYADRTPEGQEVIFSYRFGKFSRAFRPIQAKRATSTASEADTF